MQGDWLERRVQVRVRMLQCSFPPAWARGPMALALRLVHDGCVCFVCSVGASASVRMSGHVR